MTVYLLSGKDMFRQEERLATLLKEFSIGKDYVTTFQMRRHSDLMRL